MSARERPNSVPAAESAVNGIPASRRVVVKVGTALLAHDTERLNIQTMASLVEQIAQLHSRGWEVSLVTSGAVAAGHHVLGISRAERDVPMRQVLAAAGQGRLMHMYEQLFDWHGIPVAQALLTRGDLSNRQGYLNVRNTLLSLLQLKVIPIINENDVVAVDELGGEVFGDNDNLSAMVANFIDADLLVLLGEVEGLYTADPRLDPNAELVRTVEQMDESIEALAGASSDGMGRGGMTTKLEAAKLATASGVNVVIADGNSPDVLKRLVAGERIGTLFPATSTKMESRKRWMLAGMSVGGGLVVDKGAADAVVKQNRSLLPTGIARVVGSFKRGDIVSISDADNAKIAAGISNYDSDDLVKISGKHSDQIADIVERKYGDEAVHRNNMVVL